MFTFSLFFSRPCVEEPRSGYVPQRHKSVVPNPPIYCLYQHILYVTCHSPFISGLKVIMYNITKSVAARTFSLLDSASVALRKISRPLPSLQIRAPCPPLVPLWTLSLSFTRHLAKSIILRDALLVQYTRCRSLRSTLGVVSLYRGKTMGFPPTRGLTCGFSLRGKTVGFPPYGFSL